MVDATPTYDDLEYQELKYWKYRTTKDMIFHTGIIIPERIEIRYIVQKKPLLLGRVMLAMETNGDMCVYAEYCTDGASGPTVDTPDTMYPAVGHDGLYQFMRKGLLKAADVKDKADRLLEKWLVQCGLHLAQIEWDRGNHMKARWIRATIKVRAAAYYLGVKVGGGSSCQPGPEPNDEVKTAPGPEACVVV